VVAFSSLARRETDGRRGRGKRWAEKEKEIDCADPRFINRGERGSANTE